MSQFENWQDYAVVQRNPQTGCIPTGYEMLARAAGVQGIDFDTFQDDFDLDTGKMVGTDDGFTNNFESVADAVLKKYPKLVFSIRSFNTGVEKIAFIDEYLPRQPVLISLTLTLQGGWHIMPIIEADEEKYCLLKYMTTAGRPDLEWMPKQRIADIHNQWPGGKEVAFLESAPSFSKHEGVDDGE